MPQILTKVVIELLGNYNFSIREPGNPQRLYYLDLRAIIGREIRKLENEVPIAVDSLTSKIYHNPVTISLYALYLWDSFKQGERAAADSMLLQARWLKNHNHRGAWIYPISVPRYSASPGWRSAMAQGLAISVFTRAYELTHELGYRDAALQAAAVLTRPIEADGCSHFDQQGLPFLEEVAVNPPAHILNGAIFALWGLYDLESISNAFNSFKDRALKRLTEELPRYDLGYWSGYDQMYQVPASRRYHLLHIAQLKVLHILTGEPIFRYYADKWQSYLKDPLKRIRAFGKKAWFSMKEAVSYRDHGQAT